MTIKILQTNVGRAYAAQDMAYATAQELDIDILVQGNRWIKDQRTNIAALIINRKIGVIEHRSGEGHLIIRLKDYKIVCCYISPNINIQEYNRV